MNKVIGVVLGALLTLSASAEESNKESIGYPSVASAFEALKADPEADIRTQDGWTILSIKADKGGEMWSFTPASHPAHPAAVKRTVVENEGKIFIELRALCQAPKAPCDALIEQFKQLNEQVMRSMNGGA